MQGVLLILYILVISSLIAVVGDRVGYRVGKKRLTLFNLRPRHTAILVAIVTGLAISSLTLATLLLLNRSLTTALFDYQRTISTYQISINTLTREIEVEQGRLQGIQAELETARTALSNAQAELRLTQTQRGDAQERLRQIQDQVQELRDQLAQIEQERSDAQDQLPQLRSDLQQLRAEAADAQSQKRALELDRDRLERSLSVAQSTLTGLEAEKTRLESEIQLLWQSAQRFRQGPVVILAGEILAVGVVDSQDLSSPLPDPSSDEHPLRQQVNAILAQAEAQVRQLGARPPDSLPTALQVRRDHVDEALEQMVQDPDSWVVRVISVSNRLEGEAVPAILDLTPNQHLFTAGDTLARIEISPGRDPQELQEDLLGLLSTANLRSRQAGLLSDPLTGTVGEFSQVKLLEMVGQLQRIQTSVDVHVVTDQDIYTAGPLEVSFRIAPIGTTGSTDSTDLDQLPAS